MAPKLWQWLCPPTPPVVAAVMFGGGTKLPALYIVGRCAAVGVTLRGCEEARGRRATMADNLAPQDADATQV